MLYNGVESTKKVADNVFSQLLNAIAEVNHIIGVSSSEELSKGHWDAAQQWNEKSNRIIKLTKELSDLKRDWDNIMGGETFFDKKEDETSMVLRNESSLIPEIDASKRKKYVYSDKAITMEFTTSAGGSYSYTMDKKIFREVCKYTIQYIENKGYAQAKDMVAELEKYLLSATENKDRKSPVYKPLKFLADIGILKYRNGRTGCYELPGSANVALDFLDNFDKPNK
ncbi:MAG: hypothetical protein KBI24_00605 [Selenomonas sp.]|nr:hypothetical protein [Selenomonas sp.]